MSISIRFARPDDAEIIVHFVRELASFEGDSGAVEVTAETMRKQMESDAPPFESVVAENDDEPVGFALFFHTYSTWRGRSGMWLEDLFVSKEHRGQGIGRALLAYLGEIAVERRYARMEWTVLNWNTQAQDFYRSLGAAPLEDRHVWRLNDSDLAHKSTKRTS